MLRRIADIPVVLAIGVVISVLILGAVGFVALGFLKLTPH
jgi:hypothetical protein